ncbi:MAG: nucleotide exchange factor GrpE [Bacilli bacterium]|nr:nucleotide exchange factor GrpE [Bacilli bacterium]
MEENKEVLNEEQINQEKKEIKENKKKEKHKDKTNEELLKLQELLGQEREKSMRIQAEMMNFKRRKDEEVDQYKKYANEDVLKQLIQVCDNFERALGMESEENAEFLKGFKMIYTNILSILSSNGVVEIEAMNAPFDPNVHQAVLTEVKEGVEAGIVIEVLQKGYMYKDRVLRAAMVKVSEN